MSAGWGGRLISSPVTFSVHSYLGPLSVRHFRFSLYFALLVFLYSHLALIVWFLAFNGSGLGLCGASTRVGLRQGGYGSLFFRLAGCFRCLLLVGGRLSRAGQVFIGSVPLLVEASVRAVSVRLPIFRASGYFFSAALSRAGELCFYTVRRGSYFMFLGGGVVVVYFFVVHGGFFLYLYRLVPASGSSVLATLLRMLYRLRVGYPRRLIYVACTSARLFAGFVYLSYVLSSRFVYLLCGVVVVIPRVRGVGGAFRYVQGFCVSSPFYGAKGSAFMLFSGVRTRVLYFFRLRGFAFYLFYRSFSIAALLHCFQRSLVVVFCAVLVRSSTRILLGSSIGLRVQVATSQEDRVYVVLHYRSGISYVLYYMFYLTRKTWYGSTSRDFFQNSFRLARGFLCLL